MTSSVGVAVGALALGGIFYLGWRWISRHPQIETMKAVVWLCLINGFAWVWCSYLLAYLGREQIAESLSQVALAEILGVVLAYALKSLVENLSKNNNWPDKGDKS